MKILVTGGAGFIGSHLVRRLLKDGHGVIVTDNMVSAIPETKTNLEILGAEFIVEDVSNKSAWSIPILDGVDVVFNLACPASPVAYMKNPFMTLRAGSLGVFNAVRFCEKTGALLFQTSTSEVYGDPTESPQRETYWGNVNPRGPRSVYDESKRFSEAVIYDALRRSKIEAKVVRIFNTYGPNMKHDDGRAVPNFVYQALKEEPITLHGDGSQTRSLCYIDDTINALLTVLKFGDSEPYNVGNPNEISMKNLANMIIKKTLSSSIIEYHPIPTDDPKRRIPDITRIKSLGWEPKIGLGEGLDMTIDWFMDWLDMIRLKPHDEESCEDERGNIDE